ncbi:lysophospholipid acyltransferase family protein [Pseudolysinimonas sp.]|uniref:lysophospholipid acyltransferase family protein n=1 Tax=Pseudolysinimonas sp. TaxID=2680009 RepID=UPI003F7DB469
MTGDDAAKKPPRDRFNSKGHAAARFVAQHLLLKPVVWSVVTVQIHGREKLKKTNGAFIVVANHSSHLDAPLILGSLPRKMSRYLAAGAAADYFFDVWWRRGLTALFFNAFPVDRTGNHPRRVSAKELLQRGVPLLVFPEGGRSKDLKMHPFKPGAAALAISVGVPIVPVALVGAGEAHPSGSSWPKPGRLPVGVVFGDPMTPGPDENAVTFMTRVHDVVEGMVEAHGPRILASENSAGGATPPDDKAGTGSGGAAT